MDKTSNKTHNTNIQIRRNFYSNIFVLVLNILVGLYYTPYLVDSLGLLAYAIVPLALIINQSIGVVSNALTVAFTRFYSVSFQKKDFIGASKNLSTSFIATFIIALAVIPIMILFILNIEKVFTIPEEYISAGRLLFTLTISGFILSMFSSLLNVIIYAQNRLDYMNIIKTIRFGGGLLFTIIFFNFIDIRVEFVGLANLSSEVVILIISTLLYLKLKGKKITIELSYFDKYILYSVIGMSCWIMIHQLGDILIYRIDTILINIFWGAENSARIGAIGEFGSYIISITSVLGGLFGPIIIIEYSNNNYKQVKNLALTQTFIVGTLAAILAGVLSGISPIFLQKWLGNEFSEYGIWLLIKLFPIPFYASAAILSLVYRAWNYVKIPAIMTVLLGLLNTAIISLIGFYSNGTEEKYIILSLFISAIFNIGQSYILSSFCVNKLCGITAKDSLSIFIKISSVLIFSCLSSYLMSYIFSINSFITLIIFVAMMGLINLILTFIFVYNKENRKTIIDIIK